MIRKCAWCGRPFTVVGSGHKYCRRWHREAAYQARRGRQVLLRAHFCRYCKTPLPESLYRVSARYCCASHRNLAYLLRKRLERDLERAS